MTAVDAISSLFLATSGAQHERSFWLPPRASTVSDSVDFAFNVVTGISIFFFVLIVILMVVFVIKYRRRDGHEAQQTATHRTALELTWSIIPLLLVIVIFYVGLAGFLELRTSPADAYEINVTGQKWHWEFNHRSGCNDVNILRVPVNRPVRLVMGSNDVLHSMFIPAFRVKFDVVPGRYTTLWFEATKTGTFDFYCAEYCGAGHSQMVGQVIVYEEDEFEKALRVCREWADSVEDAHLHLVGAQLYNRCQQCHSTDGSPGTGPSFQETHELMQQGGERALNDGRRVVVDENYLRESILNPRADIVAGYPASMPPFQGQLNERQLRSLIEFIRRLDEIELDDKGRPVLMTPQEIMELAEPSPAEGDE